MCGSPLSFSLLSCPGVDHQPPGLSCLMRSWDMPRGRCFTGSSHGWVLLRWLRWGQKEMLPLSVSSAPCQGAGCWMNMSFWHLSCHLCVPWGMPGLSPHVRQHLGRFHQLLLGISSWSSQRWDLGLGRQ